MVEMVRLENGDYVPKAWCTFANPATTESGKSEVDDVEPPCSEGCKNECESCTIQAVFNDYAKLSGQGKCNTLVLLHRANGFYGGYEWGENGFEQVFNDDENLLPLSLMPYIEKKYVIHCLGVEDEAAFMEERITLVDYFRHFKYL